VTEPDENAPSPESLARMADLFPVLDLYEPRFRTPLVIAPGSDLAADDVDGPWPRVSEVIMGSLIAAHDHLVALADHVRSRKLYLYADASLLRTALLSAAQAFWILAPEERAERQRRCRTLAAHDYVEHLKYLKDLSDLQATRTAADATADSTHQQRVATARDAVAATATALEERRAEAGGRAQVIATDVIKHVAAHAFPDDPTTAMDVLTQWRHGSGAAHGLGWHVLTKSETRINMVDDERMVLISRASLDDLVPTFVYAVSLLVQAFSLLDQRNTGPTPF